jgi:hypothetical protein
MSKLKNIAILNKIFGKKEIHIEAPQITEKKLLPFLLKYRPECYCLCPVNHAYIRIHFGMDMTKEAFRNYLKNFYLKLKHEGLHLYPHVHISRYPERTSNKIKRELIMGAYNFFKNELKIKPTQIIFGWYKYDGYCKKICKDLGLEIVGQNWHVYDFWLKD